MRSILKALNRWLPERWYRDVWLFIVTLFVWLSFMAQGRDRHQAVLSNVEARYSDCRRGNETLASLRVQVEQGKRQRPFLLKLLPQFNTPKVLALIQLNEETELKGFAARNCVSYALEALPGYKKTYRLPRQVNP